MVHRSILFLVLLEMLYFSNSRTGIIIAMTVPRVNHIYRLTLYKYSIQVQILNATEHFKVVQRSSVSIILRVITQTKVNEFKSFPRPLKWCFQCNEKALVKAEKFLVRSPKMLLFCIFFS